MAEGLDLASRSVRGIEEAIPGTMPEGQTYQSEGGAKDVQSEENEPEPVDPQEEAGDDRIQVPEEETPLVLKPQPVKRKLILKKEPMAERPIPARMSQRHLGKRTARMTQTSIAEYPIEIASEDDQATPQKPESEPEQATDREDIGVPPVQKETGTAPEGMTEGQNQSPESGSSDESERDEALLQAEEEARYQMERKRKGKAVVKRKPSTKKPRTVNTGVVITEAAQNTPSGQQRQSDSEYEVSEESESDSDTSMEDEEYKEQQLPNDHLELLHPPAEPLRYKRWTVELTDDVVEEMKMFDNKKLQSVYRTKNAKGKKVKSGKVIHLPSLDELQVRESFLALLRELGFEWLLRNEHLSVPVDLAKEFFATFRFKVTTDLDEECISFRIFGGEIRMNLIEWTVRLGICSLEEATGLEWRERERGIPRRHVEFEPQSAWEELTHPGAGQFQSTISRSIHFNDPVLRLVQLFLDYNLLGQSNSAVRTSMTELYLIWCAKKGKKLHLGFWTAYTCHLIATHPARNISLCHILGIFFRNNITVSEDEDLTPLTMVDAPGLFDTPLFVRTNTVYMKQGVPHFYAMGEEAIPTARLATAPTAPGHDQGQDRMEQAVEKMAEENRQMREEMVRLASVMERMLKDSEGQSMLTQRQAAMETMVTEMAEENRQLKAEVAKLAGEVNRLLKGTAEQHMMRQRQEAMEAIVSDLGEENFKMQATMNRLLTSMGEVLEEMTYLRKEQVAGSSGHGGRSVETKPPQIVTEEPEDKKAEEPATETKTGTNEEAPTEQPAPPAPRRSRRHR